MLKNYIIIAYRNILKSKFYSVLNILGLSIGVVSTILIALYIQDELSFDKYHAKSERIYRLESNFSIKDKHDLFAPTALPLAKTLKNDYPEIENYVRFSQVGNTLLKYEEKKFFEDSIYFADSTVFDVFNYHFLQGDAKEALNKPYSMVITKTFAHKYFGKENAVGKTFTTGSGKLYKVTAVIEDLPTNTHMRFNALMSMNTLAEIIGNARYNSSESLAFWSVNFYSYILLKPNASIKTILDKSPAFYDKYMAEIGKQINGSFALMATRLDKIHFNTAGYQGDLPLGNMNYIYIFTIIAIFILLIGCINYMNMATARSANRSKEVGLRKVVGAERGMLIRQFLSESVFISLLALGISLLLMLLLLPVFNELSGKHLTFGIISNPSIFGAIVVITIFVGLLSGSYPSFFLSNIRPLLVLKGKGASSRMSAALRKILVIIQFVMTSVLIIGTMVITQQLSFMRNMNLGFDKENIVVLEEQDTVFVKKIDAFKEELKKSTDIVSVAAASTVPGTGFGKQVMRVEKNGEMVEQVLNNYFIDYDYIDVMNVKISKGRNFDRNKPTDVHGSFIINETAAKKLGWGDSALGKKVHYGFDLKGNVRKRGEIIAVVKDFHYESLHNQVEPLILMIDTFPLNLVCVKTNQKNRDKALEYIKSKRTEFNNTYPLNYYFVDSKLDEFYKSEQRIATIFSYFTLLTIIIAGLGMIGLSAFMAEQRTKEIGIRKVLGSPITKILMLFAREFSIWVVIANVFAWIIAYVAMNKWLEDFVYRWIGSFDQNYALWILMFGATFVITLFFALATVSWQVVKVALMNPVESIKYE